MTLNDLMRERPANYRAILAVAAQQVEDLRLWAAAMRGRNTLQRIAYWLLQQVVERGDAQSVGVRVVLSRRDLASFLDMTSETLCRGLNQLSTRGAIKLRSADIIAFTDIDKLRHYARSPDPRIARALGTPDSSLRKVNPFSVSDAVLPPAMNQTQRRQPILAATGSGSRAR